MKKLAQSICATTALALLSSAVWADEVGRTHVHFVVEPQTLREALNQWAEQAGLSVIWPAGQAEALVITPRVAGELRAEQALQMLLEGSGLTYSFVDSQTVAIRSATQISAQRIAWFNQESDLPTGIRREPVARIAEAADSQSPRTRLSPGQEQRAAIEGEELEEVIVTGSQIRGVSNKTVPLTVYDRESIEQRGRSTLQDFITSLPQNFKGGSTGASPDGILEAANGLSNIENASSANLRGLGNSSTLTLLNGHRLAASAFGDSVDLSAVPLEAVERIDVLTDGASALYGADAVGGVVNVILRRDFSGAETNVRAGMLTQGGGQQMEVGQTLGAAWEGGNVLAIGRYQDAKAIASSDRAVSSAYERPTDIYPSSTRYSVVLSGRQDLSWGLSAFADAVFDHARGSRQQALGGLGFALSNTTDSISATIGASKDLAGDWRLELSEVFSQVDTSSRTRYTPSDQCFPTEACDTNGVLPTRNEFTLNEVVLKADGTLFGTRAGRVKATAGGSYRAEAFESTYVLAQIKNADNDRRVKAAFAEIYAPLVGDASDVKFVRNLDLSFAVRRDSYNDFGSTTNGTVGLFWSPVSTIGFRAAFGSSFRAPVPSEQLSTSQGNQLFIYPDIPLPDGTIGRVIFFGDTRPLDPERAKTLTAGIDYKPSFWPGLSLSANYYRIKFTNRIVNALTGLDVLSAPETYGPLIGTFSSDADAAAFVDQLVSQGYALFDFSDGAGDTTGIRYSFPSGLVNAAHVRTEGFDFTVAYGDAIGEHAFSTSASATVIREITTAFCNGCTTADLSDTYGNPVRLRLRGDATWSMTQWSISAGVNFSHGYADTNIVPNGKIGSFTTIDTAVRYSFPSFPGTTVTLIANNLFNADAPQTALTSRGLGYDPANADPRGRELAVQIRTRW